MESINNPCIVTIAVNQKEYFEQLNNRKFNKKHNGVRKNSPGTNSHSYTSRILYLRDHEELQGATSEKQIKKRLQVKNGKMKMMIKDFILLMVFFHYLFPIL